MADGVDPNQSTYNAEARNILLRRLIDVVALPESESSLQDRAIAGDLLLEMLIDSDEKARILCAKRLSEMSQAPRRVLRFLANDTAAVSKEILENSTGLDQSDLCAVVRNGAPFHRLSVARRKDIGSCVSDAIAESGDVEAMARMLANSKSDMSDNAIDRMVSESRHAPQLTPLLMRRRELKPAHALVLFWWSDRASRKDILRRFSAERTVLIEACSDIFKMAADENWSDPVVRKGLQVIERRQRNRAAMERSEYENLEDAIAKALKFGMTPHTQDEISYMCGIKPLTGAKIFRDPGGEGIAILCKAVGLKRQYFKALWAALKRPISRPNVPDDNYEQVLEVYEMMAVAKAQTVLRYWNWSLSSAFTPEILEQDAVDMTESAVKMSPSKSATRLVFGR